MNKIEVLSDESVKWELTNIIDAARCLYCGEESFPDNNREMKYIIDGRERFYKLLVASRGFCAKLSETELRYFIFKLNRINLDEFIKMFKVTIDSQTAIVFRNPKRMADLFSSLTNALKTSEDRTKKALYRNRLDRLHDVWMKAMYEYFEKYGVFKVQEELIHFLKGEFQLHIKEISDSYNNDNTSTNSNEARDGAISFKNNFDGMDESDILRHFRQGLVDSRYLTEEELNQYLKAAFELKTVPERLFRFKDVPKKDKVYAVFYKYFKNVASQPHGKQPQYAALLGDYFEGYNTKTVSTNFSKSVY